MKGTQTKKLPALSDPHKQANVGLRLSLHAVELDGGLGDKEESNGIQPSDRQ